MPTFCIRCHCHFQVQGEKGLLWTVKGTLIIHIMPLMKVCKRKIATTNTNATAKYIVVQVFAQITMHFCYYMSCIKNKGCSFSVWCLYQEKQITKSNKLINLVTINDLKINL